jgi:PAS domain S-box-containing protein
MTRTNEASLSRQEVEDRFDLLIANVREYAIFVVAPDGTIMSWNPGAERLLGYQSTEIVGQHFSRLFLKEDIASGQPEHEIRASRAHGQSDSLCWHVRKDGTRFWCASTITPLFDEKKSLSNFARVMHDLTDADAQTAQKKRSDDLVEANRSREEFMALLSHELRNPLSPILNALGILQGIKTSDPIVHQAVSVIERQVGHMVRLVDDLLDVSRIGKGKLRLVKEPVELRLVINRAVESAHPLIEARKHEFSVTLPLKPIWIDADAGRMEQVFVNLLHNAANYTNPPGSIRVVVNQEADEAVVRVQDNGIGIAPETLPHIFEMFSQIDAINKPRSHAGLGIGLALVGAVVEMHGGSVQARSAGLGEGSDFTVRLPALANAPARASKADAAKPKERGRPLRILIVEDNIDSGDTLSTLLRFEGHDVLLARSGVSALETGPAFCPEVVLCDIGLPGIDGYEVASRLRALPHFEGVAMYALTGFMPNEADCDRPQRAGFNHYFVKPIQLDKLLKLLEAVN